MQYPELLSSYIEFCQYRDGFKKTNTIDLSNAIFIYPTTFLPLLNLALENKGCKILQPKDPKVISYMLRMLEEQPDSSSKSYVPVVPLSPDPKESGYVLDQIFELQKREGFVSGGEEAFKYVVGELVDNIYQHAEFTIALVMAQKYPKKGFVELGFFDNGITIPGSFGKHGLIYDEEEAHKAISDALKGLSSKGGKERGHGLRSSVRIFLEGLGGEVLIVSGAGAVYMSKERSIGYVLGDYHKLAGTLISIRIQDLARQINIYNYVE